MRKFNSNIINALITIILTVIIIYELDGLVGVVTHSSIVQVVQVLTRTFIIFVFAFIMLRLLGKRQLSQLTFIDLLIIIALGSAVGDVMIYSDDVASLINSVVAVGFIAILVMMINKIIARSPNVGRLIEGRSTLLVKKGRVLKDALRKESMNREELMSELREHNITKISQVESAVLEPSGQLSVVRKYRKKK